MPGVSSVARKIKRKQTTGAKPPRLCPVCTRVLRRLASGGPTQVRPVFAFRAVVTREGGAMEPWGPVRAAGTPICARHEYVWDVKAKRARAVWAGDAMPPGARR